jgi:hypothetical protein
MLRIGGPVTFVDAKGHEHDALVTAIHGDPDQTPAINVVWVSDDESRRDQYGRQVERFSSVVHERNQSADGPHGNYWR